jgi:long-chain fatty acid transport protein
VRDLKKKLLYCVIQITSALCLLKQPAEAAYSNYNSVLLGDRAAGMGGAFTALTNDPSASPFYNPATLILTKGNSLSATVNLYNKYNTAIGEIEDVTVAPQRLNQGYFRSLPSSSSSIIGFKSFSLGLTILVPDYKFYSGQVKGNSDTTSFLSQVDESLWVGGTFSAKLTENSSIGFSLYYTARNLSRTVNDRLTTGSGGGGTGAIITNEIKNLSANSVLPVLGFFRRLSPVWSLGVSYRPPSLPISGEATYYRSNTVTSPYQTSIINRANLRAITKIPARLAIGVARENPGEGTLSLDVQIYEGLAYNDLPEIPEGTDHVTHRPVVNFAVGYEKAVRDWLTLRLGFFTNLSSHPEPDTQSAIRQGDHVDMNGFSANFQIKTHQNTTFSFGGYYTGGRGTSTELVGNQITIVPESQATYTMLVATGFAF